MLALSIFILYNHQPGCCCCYSYNNLEDLHYLLMLLHLFSLVGLLAHCCLWVGFQSIWNRPSAQKLYSQAPKGSYSVLMQKCIKRDIVVTTGPRNLPLRPTWNIAFLDSQFLEEVALMVTRVADHMAEISRVYLACRSHSEHLWNKVCYISSCSCSSMCCNLRMTFRKLP